MRFFRISRETFNTPAAAFSGIGASKVAHRWNWAEPALRAVYCSDSLALACLENLVHIRPLPRVFPPSVYFTIDIPDAHLVRADAAALPKGWNNPVPGPAARDYGTAFLTEQRAVGLVVPTAVVEDGLNVLINPLHPHFILSWVKGPFPFTFDHRLE